MSYESIARLVQAGIAEPDARALRRIAMTLHRWHELECGDAEGRAIERDESTGLPYWTFYSGANGKRGRTRIPDRERGAHKRLAAIMARYPGYVAHIQGDPRGAALYVLHPRDILPGVDVDSYYSRGVAVYR